MDLLFSVFLLTLVVGVYVRDESADNLGYSVIRSEKSLAANLTSALRTLLLTF
jgi:hypothetical protein